MKNATLLKSIVNSMAWEYDQVAVGKRIAAVLRQRKIKKKDLAERLDRHPTRVSKYLKGEELNAERLGQIAEILECSVDYLLGRTTSMVADPGDNYGDSPRGKLIAEVKRFALEADADLLEALLKNVRAFQELSEKRKGSKE